LIKGLNNIAHVYIMGIPAYFSYIIKNYPNILQKFQKNFQANHLYLDSNSIIYDCLRKIKYTGDNDEFERQLINITCKNIEAYVQQISPSHLVYIAFDGVAPVAKLNQQKNRRYKSWYIGNYNNNSDNSNDISVSNTTTNTVSGNQWDSTAITPGTEFMNKLNLQVQYHFRNAASYNVKHIIVSGSDQPGEGEHKIFEYIRMNRETINNMKTVIYGLDADLIMLTINHLQICTDMYLFRETPDFIRSIDKSLDPNSLYVINIPEFKNQLVYYLNNDTEPSTEAEHSRINDYIFLCFMLGNDFLPHFPALNIRRNGMDILLETYRNVLGKNKQNIIKDGKIIWRNFRKVVKELADNETMYIQNDYSERNKQETRPVKLEDDASRFDKEMLHAPSKCREVEKYINPFDDYWEVRYYDMLFDIDINDGYRKQICTNYLEGLEWTFKYYSSGCIDWRWSYKYHYPPLLKDLIKHIPYFEDELLTVKEKNPVKDLVQLSYVLPRNSLGFLPKRVENKLLDEYNDMYRTDYEFEWSYCRYFWECHVKFPEITVEQLENIVAR
jgi:5'-3' exonuclease